MFLHFNDYLEDMDYGMLRIKPCYKQELLDYLNDKIKNFYIDDNQLPRPHHITFPVQTKLYPYNNKLELLKTTDALGSVIHSLYKANENCHVTKVTDITFIKFDWGEESTIEYNILTRIV